MEKDPANKDKLAPWMRLALPIASAILIVGWWGSIERNEQRAIRADEFALAGLAIGISFQPMLLNEVVKAALRKID